jgi:hypothetical protein
MVSPEYGSAALNQLAEHFLNAALAKHGAWIKNMIVRW